MRLEAILGGIASMLLAAAPAAAQQMNDVPSPQSSPPIQVVLSHAARWRDEVLPLLEDILRKPDQLGLSRAQVESIERLTMGFAREVIRRQADRQIALLDLVTTLDQDPLDPAKPLDLSRAETMIRDIERIGAELELARLRTIEAGKAQLSAEQRAKLGGLLAADDPPDPPLGVYSIAARSGGGTRGHAGTGRPGHPSGGGAPGHHPGSHGAPHHPGYHAGYHPGYHYGFHGGVFVGAWPWYAWGYPNPVYVEPPPPSY